ncbi:hypothetical protein FO519_000508 [Halicephalobus sp. NKZ332]|nr:hypothetical protein FO519_000508 [Halicephalobus sp. NKZ332]
MSLKVAIVGQGVSGTSTALALLEEFPELKVTLFGDRPFEDITSFGPAGYFFIDEESHKRWGAVSFDRFAKLEREYGASIGVKYISGTYQSEDKEDLEELEHLNSDVVHNIRWFILHFSTYTAEGKIYVPWLKQQCEKHGATFIRREIHSLDDLADEEFDLVVNCAGLHGGKLAGDDDQVFPLRGVAFEIDAPGFKQFSCDMIETFVLPLDRTVLVGTVRQKDRYDKTITDEDRKDILERVYKTHPSLKFHKIVNEWCGLRPGRSLVRIERQTRTSRNGRKYEAIMNYGHGSNGFTLSWGTAQDVVGFTREILKKNQRSKL